MQPPVEPGGTQAAGQIAHPLHHLQGAGVVVLEGGGRHHRHGQHLGVPDPGQGVVAMPGLLHQLSDHDEGRYNDVVVHGASGRERRRQAPPVSRTRPMDAICH
jgi:hypothetical protein